MTNVDVRIVESLESSRLKHLYRPMSRSTELATDII